MTTQEDLEYFSVTVSLGVADTTCQLAIRLASSSSSRDRSQSTSVPRVLGELSALLTIIAHDIRSSEVEGRKIPQRRIHKFLQRLEAICTWPHIPRPFHLDLHRIRLHTLATQSLDASLIAWAKSSSAEKYASSFETFQPLTTEIDFPSLTRLWPDLEPSTEECIPEVASQIFYETINRHALCLCNQDYRDYIQGRLRLVERVDNDQPSNYHFDTLFIAPANVHHSEHRRWQIMRFHVPIAPRHEAFVDQNRELRQDALVAQDFCHLVRRNIGVVKLCLRIEGNQLIDDQIPVQLEDTEYPVQPVPGISLAEVLRTQQLTTRDRLVVAYIIAKSVWQYYNTDWLNTLWTTDNIHFMLEEREDDHPEELTLNPARPYLAFANGEPTRNLISESVNRCANHRYPRILALGVILVELFREKPRHRTRDNSTLDAFLNNSLLENLRTIKKDTSWPHLDLDITYKAQIKDAVALCFNCKRLEGTSSQSRDLAHTSHGRRDLLWDEVVSRLQWICKVLKLINGSGAVIHGNSHIFDRVALYQSSFLRRHPKHADLHSESSPLVALGLTSKIDEPAHSWLDRIQNSDLVRTLWQRFSGPGRSRPVRVAVLDSGYDATNEFFTDARKGRIVAWRDFLKDPQSPESSVSPAGGQDSDGHGTDVLSMALRVAPFAEFFVARVFESSANVASRSSEIAKAIRWAAEDCDVDIISMSFGFTGEQSEIRAAIREAHFHKSEQILFFAAAANEGANMSEMYPARDDRVFAIRATNHEGQWWSSNPRVTRTQHWSFMTLGQNLPSVSRKESVTGTSYATPIAAGFAAMILADARRLFTATDSTLLDTLSRHDGMRKVFRNGKLSVETAPRCSYLNPMGFINRGEDERLAILKYAD